MDDKELQITLAKASSTIVNAALPFSFAKGI
jgi:hypothetical protein